MTGTHYCFRDKLTESREPREPGEQNRCLRDVVTRAKANLFEQFADRAGEHLRVLRLALNEAEAIAWTTEFPHLFFPALAEEKARAAIAWHQRQRSVRRRAVEIAFAE